MHTIELTDEELRQLRQVPGIDLASVPQDGSDRTLAIARKIPVLKNLPPAFPVLRAKLGPRAGLAAGLAAG